ncbi:MAG: hypothetical protein ACOY0T_35390 [Myxococcota bacterium]
MTASCAKRESLGTYPIRLVVTNVTGEPLSGVTARVGSRVLGKTNEHGAATFVLNGRDGQRVNVDLECPPNHRPPPSALEVRLFHYATSATPEVTAICEQERVAAAVVVRTLGAHDVPLYARGERVGASDSQGIAHVLLQGAPGENVDLSFDTSELPDLRPSNPSVRITFGNHDDVLLAEQRFEARPKARVKTGGAPRKAAPIAQGPVRIR